MSIHRVSPCAKAATVLVSLGAEVVLDTTSAESGAQELSEARVSTNAGASGSGSQGKRGAAACRVIERPKHSIIRCECSGDPLAGVSSVDAAAMLRLFVGSQAEVDHGKSPEVQKTAREIISASQKDIQELKKFMAQRHQ